MQKDLNLRSTIAFGLIFAFLVNTFGPLPLAQAQDFRLPAPGVMVHLSPEFNPPILKGIKVHPDNPFRFDFILDKGDGLSNGVIPAKAGILNQEQLKQESTKLIKYFLASLTIPEKDLWVNLSPYEKDRIIPNSFGLTEMGRDLLAEDYMLKQITASLIYPQDEVGKRFWKRIYEEAAKKFGTTNIPVNTFNKVWILPEKAVVYENAKAGTAYVVESKLKVMLEQDYLALSKNDSLPLVGRVREGGDVNALGSQIIREIVIPELTREVNEGKNFAQLRQVYNSLILATWYKKKIKDSILAQVYADKKKIAGVGYNDSPPLEGGARGGGTNDVELIYQRYLQAFKKGVYNYIKEEKIPYAFGSNPGGQTIARKYFSGGEIFTNLAMLSALQVIDTPRNLPLVNEAGHQLAVVESGINAFPVAHVNHNLLVIDNQTIPFAQFTKVKQDLPPEAPSVQQFWEIPQLPSIDDLKSLLKLNYEIGIVYTEDHRWFFYTGTRNEIPMGILRPYFEQGRILIDIHTHPEILKDEALAGDLRYPTITDLAYYNNYSNNSFHLSPEGVSFTTRPLYDPMNGEPLWPGHDFYEDIVRWLQNKHPEAGIASESELDKISPALYEKYLNALGVRRDFIPWNGRRDVLERKLEILVQQADQENPLSKLYSSDLSTSRQAEEFLYFSYEGRLKGSPSSVRSVENAISNAYTDARTSNASNRLGNEVMTAADRAMTGKRLAKPYLLAHSLVASLFAGAVAQIPGLGDVSLGLQLSIMLWVLSRLHGVDPKNGFKKQRAAAVALGVGLFMCDDWLSWIPMVGNSVEFIDSSIIMLIIGGYFDRKFNEIRKSNKQPEDFNLEELKRHFDKKWIPKSIRQRLGIKNVTTGTNERQEDQGIGAGDRAMTIDRRSLILGSGAAILLERLYAAQKRYPIRMMEAPITHDDHFIRQMSETAKKIDAEQKKGLWPWGLISHYQNEIDAHMREILSGTKIQELRQSLLEIRAMLRTNKIDVMGTDISRKELDSIRSGTLNAIIKNYKAWGIHVDQMDDLILYEFGPAIFLHYKKQLGRVKLEGLGDYDLRAKSFDRWDSFVREAQLLVNNLSEADRVSFKKEFDVILRRIDDEPDFISPLQDSMDHLLGRYNGINRENLIKTIRAYVDFIEAVTVEENRRIVENTQYLEGRVLVFVTPIHIKRLKKMLEESGQEVSAEDQAMLSGTITENNPRILKAKESLRKMAVKLKDQLPSGSIWKKYWNKLTVFPLREMVRDPKAKREQINYFLNHIYAREIILPFMIEAKTKHIGPYHYARFLNLVHQAQIIGRDEETVSVYKSMEMISKGLSDQEIIENMLSGRMDLLYAFKTYYLKESFDYFRNFIDLPEDASAGDVIKVIAQYYFKTMYRQPFEPGYVNNSVFMNIVNVMLRLRGFNGISHGDLDFLIDGPDTFETDVYPAFKKLVMEANPGVDFDNAINIGDSAQLSKPADRAMVEAKYTTQEAVEDELERREKAGLKNNMAALQKSKAKGGDYALIKAAKKFEVQLPTIPKNEEKAKERAIEKILPLAQGLNEKKIRFITLARLNMILEEYPILSENEVRGIFSRHNVTIQDKASLSKANGPGGIDLTPANKVLQSQNAGEGIKFHLDPAMLEQLRNAPGFVPVIINIQPLKNLREFLGLNDLATGKSG